MRTTRILSLAFLAGYSACLQAANPELLAYEGRRGRGARRQVRRAMNGESDLPGDGAAA